MEQTTKLQLLDNIGTVFEKSEKCKLEKGHFEKLDAELCCLSNYFKTPKAQSFFIAVILGMTNKEGSEISSKELVDYLKCNPMKLFEFSEDLEKLAEVGIVEKRKRGKFYGREGVGHHFKINEEVMNAIFHNKPLPDVKPKKSDDVIDFLEKLYKIGLQRDKEEISTRQLFHRAKKLIAENLKFPLIKKVAQLGFETEENFLYLYVIWKTVSGSQEIDIAAALEGIYENPSERIRRVQNLLSGKNVLVKNNWIELVEADFFNEAKLELSEKSLDILEEHGITLFSKKQRKENIIAPDAIPLRELVFNETEMNQLELLNDLLEESKFTKTQKRLAKKGLPKGITVLLHGVPGTGKTETVKQLTKQTGRELMKVDISQSKSMWFGESEKVVKKIFTDYRTFAKKCERTPILFFNEADAIISKRKDSSSSNVAQTENAIQNIILEELENFDGILMATTNLADNLDAAFERRFLFKIKFQKPEKVVKQKIWQLKMPQLTEDESGILADTFDFSGGQIDNVVRKAEIQEIIHGETIGFVGIFNFCDEESLSSQKRTKIGFGKS